MSLKETFKAHKKQVIIGSIVGTVILTSGFLIGKYIYTHEFDWQSPVVIRTPVHVIKKAYAQIINTTIVQQFDPNVNPLTPDQQYGCNKFGSECVTFLAIFRAESHYNHNAIHVNANGTVDFGCMQINSIHLKTIDTNKYNLFNCQENIDVAYMIFSQQHNWSAWSAYSNGDYKNYLLTK